VRSPGPTSEGALVGGWRRGGAPGGDGRQLVDGLHLKRQSKIIKKLKIHHVPTEDPLVFRLSST
jgi:hypothetical protein